MKLLVACTLLVLIGLAALLPVGCGGGGGGGFGLNSAAAFGWRKYAETDLQMAEFYTQNFTLAAKVMLQYPLTYTGPILSASGGGFEIAKADDASYLIARL